MKIRQKAKRCFKSILFDAKLSHETILSSNYRWTFVDPSIASAALDVTPFDLINDLKTFGFIFESMVIRDLKIYAETNGASLYHYRDKNDFEVDVIIHFNNGKWAAIEIKLFDDEAIEKACKNLI